MALIYSPGQWQPPVVVSSDEANVDDEDEDEESATADIEETVAGACEMCERMMPNLTRHHLIPKKVHPRYIKMGFRKSFLLHHVVEICRGCHSSVHACYDELTLARDFNTLGKLMASADVQAAVAYHAGQRVRAKIKPGVRR